MAPNLAEVAARSMIDGRARGMPPFTAPMALADVGKRRWSVPGEDLCLPVVTVSEPAMVHNIAVINAYAEEHGLYLCSHGKTMMAPQLLRKVLAGKRAVGLCAATVAQATVMAETGAANVLVANQIVGKANIRRFAELIATSPWTRFRMLVNSEAGVEQLLTHGAAALPKGAHFNVLLEVGFENARAGLRTMDEVTTLLEIVARHRRAGAPITLGGIEAYEGAVGGTGDAWLENVRTYFTFARAAYEATVASGLIDAGETPILTAGGSATFDLVATAFGPSSPAFSRTPQIWIRAGVAPVYDHVVYQSRLAAMDARHGFILGGKPVSAVETFRPALALWAAVQSIPEPGFAIVAAGIRDFPADAGYPVLLAHYRASVLLRTFRGPARPTISKANDQHAFLPVPDGIDMRVGDVLKFGISHPCTTFDKWQLVFCVDETDHVVEVVRTYF